jgi:hypothetical protein
MATEPERSGSGAPGPAGPDRAPLRPPQDVVRDLEQERTRLVQAIEQLRFEAQTARDRVASLRPLVIAAGIALVALIALRRMLRKRG